MSDPFDTPLGQMLFVDAYLPGVQAGQYTLKIDHTLDAPDTAIESVSQTLIVDGPRFTLDPADLHARFPPKGSTSQYAEVLPHLVLGKRLLPWERLVSSFDRTVPWVALLVFDEGELVAEGPPGDATAAETANYASTTTVGALLQMGSADTRIPVLTATDEEQVLACRVITMSNATFAAIVPTARELPYLAHSRQVDVSNKKLLDLLDHDWFSVVVANRFPRPGTPTRGAKAIVHLVSLEGFGDLLSGDTPVQPRESRVKMVSLCSWTFSCLPDPSQRFSGLARNLAFAGATRRDPAALTLRLPVPPASDGADAAVMTARQRLSDGYVALGYHAPTGEDAFAWYRGPLVPNLPAAGARAPMPSASAGAIFDPTRGVFDHSLSAAWQCGRGLALSSETFAVALSRMRQRARNTVSRMVHQDTSTPVAPSAHAHSPLATLFASTALDGFGSVPGGAAPPAPRRRAPSSGSPANAMQAMLARPDALATIAANLSDDPDAPTVSAWLGDRRLLVGVPFAHLVPDFRMLPPESIRFFFVDTRWIDAMIDGALSIGLSTSHESALQGALTTELERMAHASALAARATRLRRPAPTAFADTTTGLLVRSSLVVGWPGVGVKGMAAGTEVPLLRLDHLAPDVLIAVFNGIPDTVILSEPCEGLEFGVDDEGQIQPRGVVDGVAKEHQDKPVSIYDPQHPGVDTPTLRSGGRRVLNLRASHGDDLVNRLEQALSAIGYPVTVGPAQFALQMVKGPEEIVFALRPPQVVPAPERP
ncbi:hypothetical protein [Corallococcus exiguus]|uniref:Uncharacterized protein n=1 Tax=Corallococcus exiguus TaxID=83462 RepID=A0A7X4Y843_9BACT|nr:hypothetical protein [Corallococcus exiguus]NBC39859.1 hypothetical protein [Corallococcus exiguus]TNV63338.1 hypothetical protein FH620_15505 [Corallococcus exiguus]